MTLKTWFILLPCALLGVALTLANLNPVQFSLDPFSATHPAFAVTVPLIVVIMGAFGLGLLAGGFGAWVGQGGHRRGERAAKRELKRVQKQQSAQPPANTPANTNAASAGALVVPANASRNGS